MKISWSDAIAGEPDLELRGEAYLRLASRLVAEEKLPAAEKLYGELLENPEYSSDLKSRARKRADLLGGRGAFGQRFELLARNFAHHATEPSALAAMTAGGIVYRVTRLGVASRLLQAAASPWTRGLAAQGLAIGAGFSSEIFAFTALNRGLNSSPTSWSRDLAHAAISLGALKLSAAAGGSIAARVFGPTPSSTLGLGLFQQGTLLSGILLGAELEKAVGWRENNLGLAEALSTLLHFNVAGQISRHAFGESFSKWESGLDLRWQQTPWRGTEAFGPQLAMAGNGIRGAAKASPELAAPYFLATRVGSEPGPTPPVVRQLEETYRKYFPADGPGVYSREILERACRIRCNLPDFHENLLESLSISPFRGQLGQLYTVMAIERVFETDALGSSHGSFDYAPLQLLLGRVLSDSAAPIRLHAMRSIYEVFERGFSRVDSFELLERYTSHPTSPLQEKPTYDARFHEQHSELAAEAWRNFRPQDIVPLFNHVYQEAGLQGVKADKLIETFASGRKEDSPYFASEIDGSLDYARTVLYGDLVLRRLGHILEAGDHPSKLSEISSEPQKMPTERYVDELFKNGYSYPEIAKLINGSVHTAYFNDLRLADTVVSVYREVIPYLRIPRLREENKARLIQAFIDHAATHRFADESDLFRWLRAGRFSKADFFERAWREGDFKVEILPNPEFRRQVQAWGKSRECEWTFFRQGRGNEPDRILIREMPQLDISSHATREASFSEVMWRLRGFVHELEHWRHFSGASETGPVAPFLLLGISREERLITEIMAHMEEFRWRAINSDDHFLHLARRLGDSLPLYLRNVAEQNYY